MEQEQGRAAKRDWSWVPTALPVVWSELLPDRRAAHGDAWVNQCWRRGVVDLQPGWFFAMERGIAIGVPSEGFAEAARVLLAASKDHKGGLLLTRPPEVSDGAHS